MGFSYKGTPYAEILFDNDHRIRGDDVFQSNLLFDSLVPAAAAAEISGNPAVLSWDDLRGLDPRTGSVPANLKNSRDLWSALLDISFPSKTAAIRSPNSFWFLIPPIASTCHRLRQIRSFTSRWKRERKSSSDRWMRTGPQDSSKSSERKVFLLNRLSL